MRTSSMPGTLRIFGASVRAIANAASGSLLSICTSIIDDTPKFSTWVTTSAGMK